MIEITRTKEPEALCAILPEEEFRRIRPELAMLEQKAQISLSFLKTDVKDDPGRNTVSLKVLATGSVCEKVRDLLYC